MFGQRALVDDELADEFSNADEECQIAASATTSSRSRKQPPQVAVIHEDYQHLNSNNSGNSVDVIDGSTDQLKKNGGGADDHDCRSQEPLAVLFPKSYATDFQRQVLEFNKEVQAQFFISNLKHHGGQGTATTSSSARNKGSSTSSKCGHHFCLFITKSVQPTVLRFSSRIPYNITVFTAIAAAVTAVITVIVVSSSL
jgi:hypothetical protein